MDPAALTTHIDVTGDQAVLYAAGDIDLASSDALRQALVAAFERAVTVTVDVADVGFIDSSGLTVFVWGHEHARAAGGAFRISRPSPMLRRLLEITRLETVLAVVDDQDNLALDG